jgi:hypothetical protein
MCFFGGKQEFRRTDFGCRLLAAEGEGEGGSEGEGGEDTCGWGWGVCLKWSNILLVAARSPRLKSLRRNSCYPFLYINSPYVHSLKRHNQQRHPCILYIIHYHLLLHHQVLLLKKQRNFWFNLKRKWIDIPRIFSICRSR